MVELLVNNLHISLLLYILKYNTTQKVTMPVIFPSPVHECVLYLSQFIGSDGIAILGMPGALTWAHASGAVSTEPMQLDFLCNS